MFILRDLIEPWQAEFSKTAQGQKKRKSMLDRKRLDHLGLVAGTIKDSKLVEFIDSHFKQDDKENTSTGEAIAGMIINGLGFTQRPMTLTPQFFENKPLGYRFKAGYFFATGHAFLIKELDI